MNEETKLIVDLYKHEDNLLWIKIRFMLLFNSGVVVVCKYLVADTGGTAYFCVELLAMFGIFCNLIFAVTLHGSKRHITAYRNRWSAELFKQLGPEFAGTSPLRLNTTSAVIALSLLIAAIWLVLLGLSFAGVSFLGPPVN